MAGPEPGWTRICSGAGNHVYSGLGDPILAPECPYCGRQPLIATYYHDASKAGEQEAWAHRIVAEAIKKESQ